VSRCCSVQYASSLLRTRRHTCQPCSPNCWTDPLGEGAQPILATLPQALPPCHQVGVACSGLSLTT
jgi:hypothetical protein